MVIDVSLTQVMEEVEMVVVAAKKVEMMVGFQPSLSRQPASRPLTMPCVGWGLLAAVLLVKMRIKM